MAEPARGPGAEDLRLHDSALALAAAASAVLLPGAHRAQAAEEKGAPIDLVTRFDRAAEEVIVAGIRARHPGHRILAEESGALDAAGGAGDGAAPRWIVDPLDGTTNFSHGLPFFSISIACEVEGTLRAAVVCAPALGWTFSAVRGGGAFRNGEPVVVSRTAALERALLATGFPYDRRTSEDNNLAQFAALERRVQGVRRAGSAALDLAMVACGWFDGYWEKKLKAWDVAAGILLVQEAGGRVSDYGGGPVDLQRCEVLATNGPLHGLLMEALAQVPQGA